MGLVGGSLVAFIQRNVPYNIWQAPFRDVERFLNCSLRIIERWERVTHELTAVQWSGENDAWEGRCAFLKLGDSREVQLFLVHAVLGKESVSKHPIESGFWICAELAT